jgi:anti-sigma B factor antagonist
VATSFSVDRSQESGVSLLALNGYLDAHTAPQFEKVIQEEYEAGRVRILVDCAGLTYISSAGLGVFMSFIEDVREAGGDIKLCSLAPAVFQVFEILGFPERFEILPDRPAGLQRFAPLSAQEA